MDKNLLYNAQIDFFIITSYDLKIINRNVRATGHNVVSDTRVFRFNYWLTCSITQSFMITDSGIQCAYGQTILHGRTFGTNKFVNNTGVQSMGD